MKTDAWGVQAPTNSADSHCVEADTHRVEADTHCVGADTHCAGTDAPFVHTTRIDTVWFQVGGTICNLKCNHCFISCSPDNDKFRFMSLETCAGFLSQAAKLGVKEYYFTGGEPFANPELCDILELTLSYGPATVLTNATLMRESTLESLERIKSNSIHVLEIRVSLDGYSAEMNDPIRGSGTFVRAMEGIRKLVERGFRPIITIARTWCGDDGKVLAEFVKQLEAIAYSRPRLKILPLLKLGAEVDRGGGYDKHARVTHEMMNGFDQSQLLCSSARLVTDQGVWVCPILLDSPEARMSDTLAGAVGDYPLRHAACHTCWRNGPICSNQSSAPAQCVSAGSSPP